MWQLQCSKWYLARYYISVEATKKQTNKRHCGHQWGGDGDLSELYPPTSKPQSSLLVESINLSLPFPPSPLLSPSSSSSSSSSSMSCSLRDALSALGPLQILRWRVRWYLVRKALWHFSQTKSLRPSCEFMCFFRWLVFRKCLLHFGHCIRRSLFRDRNMWNYQLKTKWASFFPTFR